MGDVAAESTRADHNFLLVPAKQQRNNNSPVVASVFSIISGSFSVGGRDSQSLSEPEVVD
jgi:hypothetical protein